MAERARRRLDQPAVSRRFSLDIDPEAFGRFSEGLARLMGTGKFLFWQSMFVIAWITVNILAGLRGWDPYPFILLNLAFSTQAAYAAPLILLAQNRQDDRDRVTMEEDRSRAAQTKADTEYLARELAAVRINIGDVATRDYLRGEMDRIRQDLAELTGALQAAGAIATPAATERDGRSASKDKAKKSKRDKASAAAARSSQATPEPATPAGQE